MNKELGEEVLKAVNRKDLKKVKELIAQGAFLDEPTNRGSTPLTVAIRCGSGFEPIAEALIEAGADVNILDDQGEGPMIEAARKGAAGLIRKLAQTGANINAQNVLGSSPLMEAAAIGANEAVEELLKHKPRLDLKSKMGSGAVGMAAGKLRPKALEMILNAGGNPNETDGYENSALISAALPLGGFDGEEAKKRSAECVKLLLKMKADPNWVAKSGNTAIANAFMTANWEVGEVLLDAGANPNICSADGPAGGMTPLMSAVGGRNLDMVKKLLGAKKPADPNFKNQRGERALDIALAIGGAKKEENQKSAKIVMELLEAKAIPGEVSEKRRIPLMGLAQYAVLMDSEELLDFAKNRGLLATPDTEGLTALHYAVMLKKETLVKRLLAEKVSVDTPDKKGETPLSLHAQNPMPMAYAQLMAMAALSKGGEEKAKEMKKQLELANDRITDELLGAGADINRLDKDGDSVLMIALKCWGLRKQEKEFVEKLVAHGADVARKNETESEESPIMWVIKHGEKELAVKWLEKIKATPAGAGVIERLIYDLAWSAPQNPSQVDNMKECLEEAIKAGAQVNWQDAEEGNTPMIVAAAAPNEEFTRVLLELGADCNKQNNAGEIPLFQAIANNDVSLGRLLLKAESSLTLANEDGETAMEVAMRRQNSIYLELLREERLNRRQRDEKAQANGDGEEQGASPGAGRKLGR